MKKYLIICLMTLCTLMLAACRKSEKYTVEILIPAGSTADFVYSDTEIRPIGNKITISSGAGLGDTEVILKPVEVKQKTAYEPTYLTHGMPVKMDAEKGGWFKIGVSVQNDSDKGPIAVSVEVEGVEVRIAERDEVENTGGAPLAPADTDLALESVSHIEVMSGLTGQKINVKDADHVQNVMNDIESLKYEKKSTAEEVDYAYRIRFYNENYDELGRIFITEENGHQISYDGYYYFVEADQNINVDYLEELLKDAPPAEPGDEGNDEISDIEPKESDETVIFHDKVFYKSDLSQETMAVEETAVENLALTEEELDRKVAEIILDQNRSWYTGEECRAEGHIILESEVKEGTTTVYALMMYGEYQFQNVDYLIKASGTGVIPVVLSFGEHEDGREFTHMTWPKDGSGYDESIKEMFPEHLWNRVLTIQEEDREQLTAMERAYAEEHLKMTGRDAVIGDYADVEHTYLTDYGISVDVSNKLLEHEKNMGPYPSWHGTLEKVEDGERYMYSVFYDEETNQIIYEKRFFGTHESVEKYIYDAETGDLVEE